VKLPRLRNYSIKKKLTFIVMFVSIITFILASIIFVVFDRHLIKEEMVDNLTILADIIGSNSTAAILFDNQTDAAETLKALVAEQDVQMAVIYTDDGLYFASYMSEESSSDAIPKKPRTNGYQFENNYLELYRNIMLNDKNVGIVYLRMNLDKMQARLQHYSTIVLVAMLISSIVALLITFRLQRLVSEPILRLAKTAKKVSSEKDYSIRVDFNSRDETGILVDQFNDMLDQIQERDLALLKAHNELEERVKDRTKELEYEIAERKTAEHQIKESLKEKEILLKEIHHRVKNNLQVITSLLNLQSKSIKDQESLEMFRDSQTRVKSMALIHEKLYQSNDLAQIDFREYVNNLTGYLNRSFAVETNRISLKLSVDEVYLGVDAGVPCGLIINELVSNCFKHAFPGDSRGEIKVRLSENDDGNYELIISDNGVGFPEHLDFKRTKSLGLQLINKLAQQLGGHVNLKTECGTRFEIIFPNTSRKTVEGEVCQMQKC